MREFLFLAMAALLLSSCGAVEPYVYKRNEFNRASATFNREPKDLAEVSICYNTLSTTPDMVSAMAQKRCQDFGKQARFRAHVYDECPLLTPVGAAYDCIK
ncbi:MAG: hypothetical protein KIT00_09910 [Rhodospirillales bacterium]|nr:hypothetical protein [Rhodospirillales bacterium]